jgi:hypothetical protein
MEMLSTCELNVNPHLYSDEQIIWNTHTHYYLSEKSYASKLSHFLWGTILTSLAYFTYIEPAVNVEPEILYDLFYIYKWQNLFVHIAVLEKD